MRFDRLRMFLAPLRSNALQNCKLPGSSNPTLPLLYVMCKRHCPCQPFGTGQAFFSGVKADAGRAVLQPAMRLLPNSCKLLAKFVKQTDCKFRFNSIAIFRDVSTSPHRDAMNGSYENLIIPLSSFSGGEIWCHDPQGTAVEVINGTP